jgi:hypothetical protein
VWPDGCPPSHSRPLAAPEHGLRPASSKRASQTSDHNHVSPVPRRLRESARSAPNPHSATPPISTSREPITLSVRASTIGSVEPCFSIRIARRFDRLTL